MYLSFENVKNVFTKGPRLFFVKRITVLGYKFGSYVLYHSKGIMVERSWISGKR